MFTEDTLKTLKKGDKVYVGPRRSRNAPKDPRGEMVVVKKGIKWVYIATQEHIDWWKERGHINEYDERVEIKPCRNMPPVCEGYESPQVFESEADYQAWVHRSAVRQECYTLLRDTYRQNRALESANIEKLEQLRDLMTEIMAQAE